MKAIVPHRKLILAPLVVGGAVFWLNDLLFLLSDFRAWLVADYATRSLVIALCLVAIHRLDRAMLRPVDGKCTILWTTALTIAGLAIDQAVQLTIGYDGLFHYPAITDLLWLGIDSVIGLTLVAASEEMLARGVLLLALERLFHARPAVQIAISSVWFASFHWSLGWGSMLAAALTGIPLMLSLRATRSLIPAILAHYVIDVVLLAAPQWL